MINNSIYIRSFIAIELPNELKDDITNLIIKRLKELPINCNFVKRESLHITLKFLGDVEPEQLSILFNNLKSQLQNYGTMTLYNDKAGFFGSKFNPKIIWVGLNGEIEKLIALAKICDESAQNINIPKDDRKFSSHITIARIKNPHNANLIYPIIEKCECPDYKFLVSKIYIKKSVLTPNGAIYSNLYEIPLI